MMDSVPLVDVVWHTILGKKNLPFLKERFLRRVLGFDQLFDIWVEHLIRSLLGYKSSFEVRSPFGDLGFLDGP
jgi:hypothetical protein